MSALWRGGVPLVLASKSVVRRALLQAAGIPAEAQPAAIDERAVEAEAGALAPEEAALLLAQAKAKAVAAHFPGRLVLGADQTLDLAGRRFSKPKSADEARAQMLALRSRTHALHSAIAMCRDGEVLFAHVETARLTMRPFSDDFLTAYLAAAGPVVQTSVGGYQLEGLGAQLFERVEGDHFTVLGLPLFPLLAYLRRTGVVVE